MSQIPVQDLMNLRIPTVLETASLNDAAVALLEHDSSEVYVVSSSGVLLGIVPEYEVLKAHLCGTALTESITSLISRTPQTVSPHVSAVEVASLFREGFRSSLAVVDAKGRLLGQIKRREILWLLTTLGRLRRESAEDLASDAAAVPKSGESVPEPNFLRRRQADQRWPDASN